MYENTPQFEALWNLYVDNHDPLYNICTEDDGKTHTFYRAHLPASDTTNTDS